MDRELVKAIMTENGQGNLSAELECLDGLREVKSSTCLLLPTTPSPHPMDFKHPLSEEISESPLLPLNDDSTTLNLQNMDGSGGDSSSSADSNSVVQDPVSAQLINNISMLDYQTLSKNGDLILGEVEDCKLNGSLNVSNRKLPSFVTWNWVIIRKVLLWFVLSGLVACLATIVALVVTMPKECNPDLPWYQGKVFYEVFPPSFKDSNGDGIGDLKGLINNLDYIQGLGASVLRLNSIFPAHGYPEHYNNFTSLLKIDPSLGEMRDFRELVTEVHSRNMSIVLDIPVCSMALPISNVNGSNTILLANDTLVSYFDPTTAAIAFWARAQNIDGIYLKDLELYVHDFHFERTLPLWKQIIGNGKIFMASEEAYRKATDVDLNVLLSRVDLIDVHVEMNAGTEELKARINEVLESGLWSKPHYPWVHWNIGDVGSERISTKHANDTLAIITLQFMLPGSVSIFYGDEKGLGSLAKESIEGDFHEHELIKSLVTMPFFKTDKAGGSILPWNSASALEPNEAYVDAIRHLADLRANTPTIYLRAIYKEGNLLRNIDVHKFEDDLVVIERWYPRRNTCVFVANLGLKPVTTDLSSKFYGGFVIGGTNSSLVGEYLYLDSVTFPPHSAVILKLDK